ncbi:MAG: hypothetical protein H7833_05595 [Magnetococcus sp. DMHC-1]|nr:hypothetical protein [Magnetococcales bacterium]
MQFGTIPNLTEEQKENIERHRQMAERIRHNQETNPAGYFKGEKVMGGTFYPPGVTPPETVYDRMLREGKIKF